MTEFLVRLKQHKLVQWALVYIAAAFSLIQVVDVVVQRFGWPDLAEKLIILALVVGFFVALVLAWYHGERGAQRVSGAELLLIALVLAVGGGLLWHFGGTESPAVVGSVATASNGFGSASTTASHRAVKAVASRSSAALAPATSAIAALPPTAQPIPAKSIAVLPFENLSTDKGNAYFADGMQDLILTKLADIGDLKVISRTSTESYGSHPVNLKGIAQQLGVATILEGSVQKAGNQVLINLQLIDANTDSHIWAQSYQRTLDNIFGVEGEVAQKVADALNARLTAGEANALAHIPTKNPQAYDDFLRGQYLDHEASKGGVTTYIPQAIAAFEKAVAADPGFALAWAWLSNERSDARYWGVDRSEANLRAAEVAAKRALALAPILPDAHLAMAGVQRFLYHNIAAAHAQDQQAVKLRPNDPDAWDDLSVSYAHLGDIGASIKAMERTVALDPTDSFPLYQLGLFRMIAGDYTGARQAATRALAINPQNALAYMVLSQVEVRQNGDVGAATQLLDNMAAGTPSNADLARQRIDLLLYQRDFAAARALATKYAGEFKTGPAAITVTMSRANVEWLAGKQDDARALYRAAVGLLTEPGADLEAADHLELGLAYARLGQANAAMKENDAAASINRRSHSIGYDEADRLVYLARIQLAVGNASAAIDTLAQVLARPDHGLALSPALLRIDPTWDPIRKDPSFQALLKKYATAPAASTSAAS